MADNGLGHNGNMVSYCDVRSDDHEGPYNTPGSNFCAITDKSARVNDICKDGTSGLESGGVT